MNGVGTAMMTGRPQFGQRRPCFSLNPLASCNRMSPGHASRVTTTPLVRRRRRRGGATLAAGGTSPQRSSVITCEDNSRFHLHCVGGIRPCAERAWVSLECTADRPVRETRPNFENTGRVVALLPQHVGGRVGSSIENLLLFRGQ